MAHYSTSDIHVASTLLTLGHTMSASPTRSQQQFGVRAKAVFHFTDSKEVKTAAIDYTNGTLRVNPRELFSRLRELKSLVQNVL